MTMITRLAAAGAVALCPALAQASPFSIQFALNGLPAPGGAITNLAIPASDLGQQSFTLGSGVTAVAVTVDNQAQASGGGVVQGSVPGKAAAPVTGPGTTFTAPYFSAGNGSITLGFAQQERYLGLLWGSVDFGGSQGPNRIDFYNGATLAGTVTGDDLQALTGSTVGNGSQGYGGSYYTLLNDTAGTFNRVVLSSGTVSFESAQFQASPGLVSVPEPASLAVAGTGLLALALLRRARRGR